MNETLTPNRLVQFAHEIERGRWEGGDAGARDMSLRVAVKLVQLGLRHLLANAGEGLATAVVEEVLAAPDVERRHPPELERLLEVLAHDPGERPRNLGAWEASVFQRAQEWRAAGCPGAGHVPWPPVRRDRLNALLAETTEPAREATPRTDS